MAGSDPTGHHVMKDGFLILPGNLVTHEKVEICKFSLSLYSNMSEFEIFYFLGF